jgi:hypothetical protein
MLSQLKNGHAGPCPVGKARPGAVHVVNGGAIGAGAVDPVGAVGAAPAVELACKEIFTCIRRLSSSPQI